MHKQLRNLIHDGDLIHHALLLRVNSIPNAQEELKKVLAKYLGLGAGHPDLLFFHDERLKIDIVRAITSQQVQKPVSGMLRIIILSFYTATREAQNALLKALEEPAYATRFILLVHTTTELLPTILSRANVIDLSSVMGSQKDDMFNLANTFLSNEPADRLVIAKDIAKEPLSKVTDFLYFLEDSLHRALLKKTISSKLVKNFLEIKGFTRSSGSSIKMCLETLALILPRI